MTTYRPDDLLPLSGIQHFLFCRRQWALIHVEQLWQENVLTVEGKILHDRVDDPFFREKRKGVIIARSVPVSSTTLGLTGICDVVEFVQSPDGIQLPGHKGHYLPAPVEYKRGKPKNDESDAAQLCAQALCLEEMLAVTIPTGYLYYGQLRRRVAIDLNEDRRALVKKSAQEMHALVQRGHTPKVKPFKGCKSCSLADHCWPTVQGKSLAASDYIQQYIAQQESE